MSKLFGGIYWKLMIVSHEVESRPFVHKEVPVAFLMIMQCCAVHFEPKSTLNWKFKLYSCCYCVCKKCLVGQIPVLWVHCNPFRYLFRRKWTATEEARKETSKSGYKEDHKRPLLVHLQICSISSFLWVALGRPFPLCLFHPCFVICLVALSERMRKVVETGMYY